MMAHRRGLPPILGGDPLGDPPVGVVPLSAPVESPKKGIRMALLDLFKEQLENESQRLAELQGRSKRGDYLIWWYFHRIVGLPVEDIEPIVCDGFNDLGIDAMRIDDTSVVHF